jgi:hypothetical protein
MTPKVKERLLNAGIAVLSGAVVASFAFFMNSSEARSLRLNKELKNKADAEWVKEQDAVIQKNLDNYVEMHTIQHSAEYKAIQGQLDILVTWVESNERSGDR